jgi:hypothetical protein
MSNAAVLRELEEAIAKVGSARTGWEADKAARAPLGHFIHDTYSRRAALVTRLKALYNEVAKEDVHSGRKFEEYKRLLVVWLQDLWECNKRTEP